MKNRFYLVIVTMLALMACRTDDPIISSEKDELPSQEVATITGFYLLNEANMSSNKSSLDIYDYATGVYSRNVYGEANPDATLGLGDVGNDLAIYGSQLWVVVNASNKVEVLDVASAKRKTVIDIKNCRYVVFDKGFAYVSAYDGSIGIEAGGNTTPNGVVAKIDTATYEIVNTVRVGRQPEQMAIVDDKLYVANSGGYSPPNYERTVSVVDLNTFTKTKDIDVAINLHQLSADSDGNLYVSSRGDYFNISSNLYLVDTKKDVVVDSFGIACAVLCIDGDTAYAVGSEFSYTTYEWNITYNMINTKTRKVLEGSFIPDEISDNIVKPYGVAVDPISKYIYITDAVDYVSPGWLWCYDQKNEIVKFKHKTGDIPSRIAFIYK
ncbi:MAG: YncE family protein [Bacteroidales bacterium]